MSFEGMPGHDLINVVRDLEPVAAVRDQEAAERRRAYPGSRARGAAEFGCAEQAGGAWRILSLGAPSPGAARAALAGHLRGAAGGHDPPEAAEMLRLADALADGRRGGPDRNECAAGPLRFRVVRVQGFARFGDDGPEPARVTDSEEGPPPDPRIDPAAPVGPSDAALRRELLGRAPHLEPVPEEERREAAAAIEAYPGVVLLPPYFSVMEDRDGLWRPVGRGGSPQQARERARALLPRADAAGRAPRVPAAEPRRAGGVRAGRRPHRRRRRHRVHGVRAAFPDRAGHPDGPGRAGRSRTRPPVRRGRAEGGPH